MKKSIAALAFLSVFILSGCSSVLPPVDVGDKLVLASEHPFIIPPQGIRFSNGATIGVQPE